ncbi:hypothetical protein FQA39_LY15233 [Lamprigera yunnana]|nr:hypothetical protein FQA39_LY15233 [Lamprigera yunnana]
MDDEIEREFLKSIDIDAQPTTLKRIFDHKTPHGKHWVSSNTIKKCRLSEIGDIWFSTKLRDSPLPRLSWANSNEVWQTMIYKEEATTHNRSCRLFEDPSSVLPRMRCMLVDWVMEVCEAYHLKRSTYHLALDYIDRYLNVNPLVPKNQLQLIGISSLFIAAKVEEVFVPKLTEFSYVCDGACSQEDIASCELLLLSALGWDLNFMTSSTWLNLYLQIHMVCEKKQKGTDAEFDFFFPQYSAYQFVSASHLIDLFTLDPGYLLFSYSVIAAAAMYFIFDKSVALRVSGLQWSNLKDCTEYMAVYYFVLRDTDDPRLYTVQSYNEDIRKISAYDSVNMSVPKLSQAEGYTMQTHLVNMDYFEQATLLRLQRMGLTVEKLYVPVKSLLPEAESDDSFSFYEDEELEETNDVAKTSSVENVQVEETTDNTVAEASGTEERPSILMFKIGRRISESNHDETINSEDLNYFTSKKKFTFDEILIGIHQCTNKQLLQAPQTLYSCKPS